MPTTAAEIQVRTRAMNQALVLGSLRQHELAAAAADSYARLQVEIGERERSQEALVAAQNKLMAYASNLEDLVTQRTAELTATNQQLEAFVYSIAHDLRAPLRAMQGYSTILVDESQLGLSAEGAGYATRISKAAQFMDSLLGDLLAFSRISQQNVVLAVTSLPEVIANIIERLQPEIAAAQGEIVTAISWPEVLAHEPTLAQVILNLVDNALKFVSEARRPVITLRTEMRGPFIRLWIEDNGLGIPLDYQEQIFRLFTRLNGEAFPGTGIGLAIVQKGVERLGGRVGLESTPGVGSQFWIELRKVERPG